MQIRVRASIILNSCQCIRAAADLIQGGDLLDPLCRLLVASVPTHFINFSVELRKNLYKQPHNGLITRSVLVDIYHRPISSQCFEFELAIHGSLSDTATGSSSRVLRLLVRCSGSNLKLICVSQKYLQYVITFIQDLAIGSCHFFAFSIIVIRFSPTIKATIFYKHRT